MLEKLFPAILCVVTCLCTGCAVNPLTGADEFMLLPVEQDVEIGKAYAPEVEKHLGGRIENDVLQEYIEVVGDKIVRICHRADIEYHFTALDHKSVNAFALPGGYIFITRGMLDKLQTEAQLASILAHEIVHVVARDTANVISKEIGMTLLLLAVVIPTNPSADAVMAAQVTRQILGLRYSRKDEREADLGGLTYMVRAGYDPSGMVELMQTLENLDDDGPPEFFSTHPSPENRITYIERRIEQRYGDASGLRVGREEYERAVLSQLGSGKEASAGAGEEAKEELRENEPDLPGSHMFD